MVILYNICLKYDKNEPMQKDKKKNRKHKWRINKNNYSGNRHFSRYLETVFRQNLSDSLIKRPQNSLISKQTETKSLIGTIRNGTKLVQKVYHKKDTNCLGDKTYRTTKQTQSVHKRKDVGCLTNNINNKPKSTHAQSKSYSKNDITNWRDENVLSEIVKKGIFYRESWNDIYRNINKTLKFELKSGYFSPMEMARIFRKSGLTMKYNVKYVFLPYIYINLNPI